MRSWADESYHMTITPNVEYCIRVDGTCQYAADNATFEAGESKRTVTVNAQYIATPE